MAIRARPMQRWDSIYVCMYVCMYSIYYIYIVYILYIYIYYIYYIYIYIYIYIYVCVCVYVCMYVYIHTYKHTYTRTHNYINIHACVHTYTIINHTHPFEFSFSLSLSNYSTQHHPRIKVLLYNTCYRSSPDDIFTCLKCLNACVISLQKKTSFVCFFLLLTIFVLKGFVNHSKRLSSRKSLVDFKRCA